jgi:hypothetical protein
MSGHSPAACTNHLDREAIGICVECRSRICSECVTKVEGINYCVACLAVLADRGLHRAGAESRPTSRAMAISSALALLALFTLMTWGLLEVALPGGG